MVVAEGEADGEAEEEGESAEGGEEEDEEGSAGEMEVASIWGEEAVEKGVGGGGGGVRREDLLAGGGYWLWRGGEAGRPGGRQGAGEETAEEGRFGRAWPLGFPLYPPRGVGW